MEHQLLYAITYISTMLMNIQHFGHSLNLTVIKQITNLGNKVEWRKHYLRFLPHVERENMISPNIFRAMT